MRSCKVAETLLTVRSGMPATPSGLKEVTRHSAARVSHVGVRSDELEKLLNSWGSTDAADSYDAETMIDDLLASTWAPATSSSHGQTMSARRGSFNAARTESFTQQTKSMNELENVLADSIDRLQRHRQVIAERITALEKDNQKTTAKFQEGLKLPEELLTNICVQMEDLEERFTKVSSTAVVIGDRLATLDTERTRVLDTDEMLEALMALNDPTSKITRSNNRLFNTLQDKHQIHEASRVVKKMLVFCSELTAPEMSFAVSEIERLSQTIENDLLTEFSDAQEKANIKAMRNCAESLIEYNDKEKVADRYVWNVMKDRLAKSMEGLSAQAASIDPIQDLESLYNRVYAICKEQFLVISGVFPATACTSLRELLVERLFNDPAFGIFSYLDQFLSPRHHQSISPPMSPTGAATASVSPEYVRLLCAAYERTCSLASQIEAIELSFASSSAAMPSRTTDSGTFSPLTEVTDLVVPCEAASSVSSDRERMRAFLALQMHSLFGSHRQRYFRTELDLLQTKFKEVYCRVQFPAPVVPIKQKKDGSKAAKSDKESKATAATSAPAASSTSSSANSSSTNVLTPSTPSSSNLEKEISPAGVPVATPMTTEHAVATYYEALLAVLQDENLATQYTRCMTEALERCDVVLKESEMRGELLTRMFSSFLASFVDEFLAKSMAMANELLQEPMVSPTSPQQFFTALEHVLQRIEFVEEQFESFISPALSDSPTQLTICYETKRKCMEKLERTIATGLHRVFGVVEKTVASILASTQDKNDFIGSETNMSLSCSKACKKCIDFLQPLVTIISKVLLGENRDRFLVGLCVLFKDLYLQHLQKYRFDPDGACMLLRDVNAYRQIFSGFRHDAIDGIFDILHEVANIFALPPENVGSFIRDGKLATMTKQSLTDILKRRWDYKTHGDKIQLQLTTSVDK